MINRLPPDRSVHGLSARARFLLLFLCSACVNDPVDWGDISYRHSQLGDPPAISAVMDANLPAIPATVVNCNRSVTAAKSRDDLFRAWWAVRADSNALLVMQRSPDAGRSWQSPVVVDDRDAGRRACDRPPPAISYDSSSRYIYLAYFLDARDGSGVFFAHSMNEGAMFHSPVAVIFGNNPSHVSIAGHGDSVVVVFEDPNATSQTLGIVLSRTTGHIFEERGVVTPEEVRASSPWVSLEGNRIKVWWMTPDALDRVGHREGVWK